MGWNFLFLSQTLNCLYVISMPCMSFRVNPHSMVFLNVKELLAQRTRHIWSLSDSNEIRTHNHLVHKQTLNHLAELTSLTKWSSICSRTKWLWVWISLLWLNLNCTAMNKAFSQRCYTKNLFLKNSQYPLKNSSVTVTFLQNIYKQ